jgi:PAS domain-containing protein
MTSPRVAVNEGIYDWDITSGKIFYSARVYEVLGFTARDYRTVAGWRKRIHPRGSAWFSARVIAHLKGRSERFECDYRFRTRGRQLALGAAARNRAARRRAADAVRMIGADRRDQMSKAG